MFPVNNFKRVVSTTLLGMAMCLPLSSTGAEEQDELSALVDQIQQDVASSSEQDLLNMLVQAKSAGRFLEASAAVDAWLSANFSPSPAVLLAAARNAMSAGELRKSSERFMAYFERVDPSTESAKAAGELLYLTIDLLGDESLAYQFILRGGYNHRGGNRVQQYDDWVIKETLEREDFATAIKSLAAMLGTISDQTILDAYYQPMLAHVVQTYLKSRRPTQALNNDIKALVQNVKLSAIQSPRMTFLAQATELVVARFAGDEAGIARSMTTLVPLAKAAIKANPRIGQYREILNIFGYDPQNGKFNYDLIKDIRAQFAPLAVTLWNETTASQRTWLRSNNWWDKGAIGEFANSPLGWSRLNVTIPEFYNQRRIYFGSSFESDPAKFKAQVKKLYPVMKGETHQFALAVQTFEESKGDLGQAAELWFTRANAHLKADLGLVIWKDVIEPGLAKWNNKKAISKVEWVQHVGPRVAQSIHLGQNHSLMRWYLSQNFSGDKKNFPKAVQAIAWLPILDNNVRRRGIGDFINAEYERWRKWVQGAAKNKRDKKHEEAKALLPLIDILQPAINELRQDDGIKAAFAPNPATRYWAEAVYAASQSEHDQAAAALAQFKAELSKSSLMVPLLTDVLRSDKWKGAAHKERLAIFTKVMAYWSEQQEPFNSLLDNFIAHRRDLLGRTRREQRIPVLEINTAIANALRSFGTDRVIPKPLMDAFLLTRRGRNWSDTKQEQDLFASLVASGAIWKSNYSVPRVMNLIHREFPDLRTQFPLESYFVEQMIAESTARGSFSLDYWEHGKDQTGALLSAAFGHYISADATTKRSSRYNEWMQRILVGGAEFVDTAEVKRYEQSFAQNRTSWSAGLGWFARPQKDVEMSEFKTRMLAYMAAFKNLPVKLSGPSLNLIDANESPTFSEQELTFLADMFAQIPPVSWPKDGSIDSMMSKTLHGLVKTGDRENLRHIISSAWALANINNNGRLIDQILGHVKVFAKDEDYEIVASLGGPGLHIADETLNDGQRRDLESLLASARSTMGPSIGVPTSDPRFPVFAAQQNWNIGRTQGAWDMLSRDGVDELLREMVGDLNPEFMLWAVAEYSRREQLGTADLLSRSLLTWMSSVSVPLSPQFRANVLLERARIALRRGALPVARAQFRVIAEDERFVGLPQIVDAQLMIAEVDRLSGRFDEAEALLANLMRSRDLNVRAQALFHQAKIKKDQEDPQSARRLLEQAMALDTSLEMVFFQKELQLALRDFLSARRWGWGGGSDRIIPGRNLEIAIEDRNKVMSRNFSSIELRVWTEGTQDEETLILTMADDRGELFTGELPTELGPARQGDRRLQVLGGDKIHYDLSESFVRRVNFERTGPTEQIISVLSDAELIASSGTILTREERLEQAEEALFTRPVDTKETLLSEVRAPNNIRPGNPINIQVTDPSRSTSLQPDSIVVDVTSSSGDGVASFELTETGSSSGVFEGSIPTARLPARAFASDTAEGSNPNVIISPSENLPAWVAGSSSQGHRFVAVDLNDLVSFKDLIIEGDGERAVRRLFIEGSFNNRDFTPIASFPDSLPNWQGEVDVTLVPIAQLASLTSYGDITSYLNRAAVDPRYGLQLQQITADDFAFSRAQLEPLWGKLPSSVPGYVPPRVRRGEKVSIPVLARMRGAFWAEERKTYSFFVNVANSAGESMPRLFVNGKSVLGLDLRTAGDQEQVEVKIELGRGIHTIELVQIVQKNNLKGLVSSVQQASTEPPYVVPLGSSFFDLSAAGNTLRKEAFPAPLSISELQGGNQFKIAMNGYATRTIRAWFLDVEGGVPAVKKIRATDMGGKTVLPLAEDFDVLRRNQTLEIGADDRVTIHYKDPTPFNDNNTVHEAFMQANYHNASLFPAFPVVTADDKVSLAQVRRFEAGDPVRVLITDFDRDISAEPDVVKYQVRTSSGATAELDAIENANHSGVFVGAFFPVDGEPSRASELKVVPGDDIEITYRDAENTEPGIPWPREALLERVVWQDPELRVASTLSEKLPEAEIAAAVRAQEDAQDDAERRGVRFENEASIPNYRLVTQRPEKAITLSQPAVDPATHVLGAAIQAEIIWPTNAKSTASRVTIYAQTSTGREEVGITDESEFDITVPGTVPFTVGASQISAAASILPAGHILGPVVGPQLLGDAMDQGSFTALIPVEFGDNPTESLVDSPDLTEDQRKLLINSNDTIYIGFSYEDKSGTMQWLTQKVILSGATLFDLFDRSWEDLKNTAYVGESIYIGSVDPLSNASGERDQSTVSVSTSSGWVGELDLRETLSHSGEFRTVATFIHNEGQASAEDLNAIPVAYGDTVTFRYAAKDGDIERKVQINTGSDAEVVPFSKRFQDHEMAMGTMFSIAEAYFELAKQQRRMADEAKNRADSAGEDRFLRQVRDSIDAGRAVLEDAIRQFPDSSLRAQADYLMAELELEFASDTNSEDDKRRYFENALQRFSAILGDYPESEYAPRAQYKLGFVYEEMGEMATASQEYVKLSFRYPDHELVADAMIRLAQYFQVEGRNLEAEANRVAESDAARAKVLENDARKRYATAGDVLTRLVERFPTHENAAAAAVAAGTSYISARQFVEAVEVLEKLVNNPELDAPLIKAEAYYWLGECYLKMREFDQVPRGVDALGRAEIAFTTCTVNYPETLWARRSRGVLDKISPKKR